MITMKITKRYHRVIDHRATFDKILVTVHHLFVPLVQGFKYSTLPAMFPLSYHIYSSLKKSILQNSFLTRTVSHSHQSNQEKRVL